MNDPVDYEKLKIELMQLRAEEPRFFHCTQIVDSTTVIGGCKILWKHRADTGEPKAVEFYKWFTNFLNKYVLEGDIPKEGDTRGLEALLHELNEKGVSKPFPKDTLF